MKFSQYTPLSNWAFVSNTQHGFRPILILVNNGTLKENITILKLFSEMFFDALDEDGNRLIHLFSIHQRNIQIRALLTINPELVNIRSSIG